MSKSLWAASFSSNIGDFGSGVVTLDGNQVSGGDAGFYYLGQCILNSTTASATVTVTKYNPGHVSIIGDINTFDLALTGTVDGNIIRFTGIVQQNPNLQVTVTMKKLVNLA